MIFERSARIKKMLEETRASILILVIGKEFVWRSICFRDIRDFFLVSRKFAIFSRRVLLLASGTETKL